MKVLLAFYGGGHVTAAIPMMRELRRRGHDVVALALTASAQVMEREGMPYRVITDYVDPTDPDIARFGAMLIDRHHTAGKGISRDASVAYLGSSLADLVAEVGEEAALARYRDKGLNAFMPLRTASKILDIEQPDCVIATASPRMEAALLRAAVQLGIFSVCVIDLFAILELPWLSDPGHAHMLTVYSERARQRLIDAGRRPDAIVVAGNPAFDSLADPELSARARAWREEKKLEPGPKVVLWAEQPEPANPDLPRHIRARLAQICEANGWTLMVRLHPASMDPRTEVIPDGARQSFAHEPLPVVAHAVDVVATMTSTVAMEGLLLDKPVVVIRGSQYDHLVDYSEQDGALVVQSVDDVGVAIRDLLAEGARALALCAARRALPRVGGASARVVDLIEARASTFVR